MTAHNNVLSSKWWLRDVAGIISNDSCQLISILATTWLCIVYSVIAMCVHRHTQEVWLSGTLLSSQCFPCCTQQGQYKYYWRYQKQFLCVVPGDCLSHLHLLTRMHKHGHTKREWKPDIWTFDIFKVLGIKCSGIAFWSNLLRLLQLLVWQIVYRTGFKCHLSDSIMSAFALWHWLLFFTSIFPYWYSLIIKNRIWGTNKFLYPVRNVFTQYTLTQDYNIETTQQLLLLQSKHRSI